MVSQVEVATVQLSSFYQQVTSPEGVNYTQYSVINSKFQATSIVFFGIKKCKLGMFMEQFD